MSTQKIGAIIKARREKLELSHYELAKNALVSAHGLPGMESGQTNYTITSLLNVTNDLGLPLYLKVDNEMILVNEVESQIKEKAKQKDLARIEKLKAKHGQ